MPHLRTRTWTAPAPSAAPSFRSIVGVVFASFTVAVGIHLATALLSL